MAVKRVEWQCPACSRRYAIPADLPRPTLCPKCQAAQNEKVEQAEQVETSPPVIATADDEQSEIAASETEPVFPPPPIPSSSTESPQLSPPPIEPAGIPDSQSPAPAASRYRRKYPALRTLVFVYRALAALTFVGAFFIFVYAIISVFGAEGQPERWAAVMLGLGAIGGGTLFGVTLLAFGELIRLLLDIEQNTRLR